MIVIDIIFIKLFSPSPMPTQYYSLNVSYIANKRFCHFCICIWLSHTFLKSIVKIKHLSSITCTLQLKKEMKPIMKNWLISLLCSCLKLQASTDSNFKSFHHHRTVDFGFLISKTLNYYQFSWNNQHLSSAFMAHYLFFFQIIFENLDYTLETVCWFFQKSRLWILITFW